jgi:hypothetical protein
MGDRRSASRADFLPAARFIRQADRIQLSRDTFDADRMRFDPAAHAYEATRLFRFTRDNNRFISSPAARSVLFVE